MLKTRMEESCLGIRVVNEDDDDGRTDRFYSYTSTLYRWFSRKVRKKERERDDEKRN